MKEENQKKQPVIAVRNLTMGFSGHSIMERLNFSVYPAEIFALLGGSGCGKSTLLRHLIGLLQPMSGSIYIDGQLLQPQDEVGYHALLRKMGISYQSGALFSSMTLAENIALPLEEFTDASPELIADLVDMKLHMVGLDGFAHFFPSEISGGMRKRASIARALALNPGILFLDEPSAGLDPITSAELDQLLLTLRSSLGMTMVVVTHELESIFAIADRVIMLDKTSKGILAQGEPRQLKESENVYVRNFFNRQPQEDIRL